MRLLILKDNGLPIFSNSVLRLEICSLKENHLSIIDISNIFRNTIPGLMIKNDKILVQDIIQGYIRNPQLIILTVVLVNVDITTQEIVKMTCKFDLDGDRIFNIIIKPDLVDKGGEGKVINLVERREMQMKLEWIIIRNLEQKEL